MGAVVSEGAGATASTPVPAADAEKIGELLDSLHLERTASQVDTVWEWAGRHFGVTREVPPVDVEP